MGYELKKYRVKGFPDMISEELYIPNFGELLNMQFTHLCHIDDFYKNGSDYQRYLVDKAPILGKTDSIGVTFQVQYLFPGTLPLSDRYGHPIEWHLDSDITMDPEESPYRSHLLLSECECMTEFNNKEFIIDCEENNIKDTRDLNIYMSENPHIMTPKKMPPNRLVTFDEHTHRVSVPTKPQLRFMFRLVESISAPIVSWSEAIVSNGRVGRGTEYIPTVLKTQPGKIILDHSMWDNDYYKNYEKEIENKKKH